MWEIRHSFSQLTNHRRDVSFFKYQYIVFSTISFGQRLPVTDNLFTNSGGLLQARRRNGVQDLRETKVSYRKGLWSPEEDRRLRDYILQHGISCWSAVPVKAGLQRNGKSCRLRWINYLRPGLKRGNFSPEEEEIVMKLQAKLGNKWSQIAMHLPGRTDNEVKNYWNSYLKKKVAKAQTSDSQVSLNSSSDCTNQIQIKQEEEPSDQKAAVEMNQSNSAELSNLPQVLSGDWLFLDHPNGDGLFSFDEVMNNTWPSSQVNGSESKQVGEGIFNGNGGTCMGNIQTQPDLMSQIPENGAFDLLFPTHIYDKFELYN